MSAGKARKGNGLATRGTIVDEMRDLVLLGNRYRSLKIGIKRTREGVHAR